jgi:hypothetical protein
MVAASLAARASEAQQRIEHAGDGWQVADPGVLSLAGINRVEGFVYDEQAGDCT